MRRLDLPDKRVLPNSTVLAIDATALAGNRLLLTVRRKRSWGDLRMVGSVMAHWPRAAASQRRLEAVLDDRVVTCFRDRPKNLHALLVGAVARNPKGEAVVEAGHPPEGERAGRRLLYRELGPLVDRAARNLLDLGIDAGDRVALLLSNRLEFLVALLAANRIGAITVPLNMRERRPGLRYLLNDCGAKALVFEAPVLDEVPPTEEIPSLKVMITVGGLLPGTVPFDDLLVASDTLLPPLIDDEEATAVILYTSGTTGEPKGAMLSHLAFAHSALHYQYCFDFGPGDRTVLVVPASHITGLMGMVIALLRAAGTVVMLPKFEVESFLTTAAEERITHTIMVPAMYALCLMRADLSAYDLSAWRLGVYGGAPMPEATIDGLAEALPDLQLCNAYGATETCSPVTITPPGLGRETADSVGQLVPCGEVAIMDDDGREVPLGEAGEVWIKGPMLASGYWRKPDASKAAFVGGYWRSGDIGSLDEDGWLRVFDRKKDMINRAGYKIYSAEVENVLTYHDAIGEAAVIPDPDPVLGERVHAVIVPSGEAVDAEEIRAFCAERLADYKVPERITVSPDPLPRNANGKMQKRVLVARFGSPETV